MQDLTSLEHLEDDGHTLDHLASYVMIWYSALGEGRSSWREADGSDFDCTVSDVVHEMGNVIHQLANRKKRVRDEEQAAQLVSDYFADHETKA